MTRAITCDDGRSESNSHSTSFAGLLLRASAPSRRGERGRGETVLSITRKTNAADIYSAVHTGLIQILSWKLRTVLKLGFTTEVCD